MIIALDEAETPTCGGKAGALGELRRAGLPVPDGFALPFDAYHADCGGLRDALARGLRDLGDPPVAVRSSASGEDTVHASAAGQYASVLAVQGVDAVVSAVRACWASLHSPRAASYREVTGGDHLPDAPGMAVLVQHLVDAEASGVMFTPAGPGGATEIEASWGLGPSVVGGTVTPDRYRVAEGGAVTRTVADKRTRIDRYGGQLRRYDVPAHARNQAVLDDRTAARLARLGREVAAVLGGAQDIEWATDGGRVWVLQARPVTAAHPERRVGTLATSPATQTGTPGSHGTATGTARIVRGPRDFARVRPGDILVCPYTDPAWTPLLRIAAGVVTETGGALSHAAIVAREQGIPAVLGVADATTRIPDATTVEVDGTTGTVTTAST